MAQKEIAIVFEPTQSHLDQLEVWLKDERENTGEGFYCNWGVIKRAFANNSVFCAVISDNAVGLLVWWKYGASGGIDILEVHPKHRGKGIGRRLVEATLVKIGNEGVSQVSLECVPPTSEQFWRHIGFVDDSTSDLNSYSSSVKLCRKIS